ncbi:MAG: M48 family metalloprotease [Planctomycetaceae bacterium]|nr:M48 family metalloprotease [Planctomycetaceae bacterium]
MAYVLEVLLALAVVALVEGTGAPALLPLGFALLALPAPHAVAWFARHEALAGRFRTAAGAARLFPLLALLGHGWVSYVCGFTALAARIGGSVLEPWPGPGLLLALLPYVVLELLAIDARQRSAGRGANPGARNFQVRMLLSALVPVGVLLGGLWALAQHEAWRVHSEEVALLGLVQVALLLVGMGWVLPWILVHIWRTTPLPAGPLRAALADLAARAGFRCRGLYLWRTQGLVANAAIVGFAPRMRYVLFTDGLLARLTPRELEAVFAHEMGHAMRRHVPFFALFTVAVFLAVDLVGRWVSPGGGPAGEWAAGIGFLVALGLWYGTFGWLSRRFELDADLFALDLTKDGRSLIEALEGVSGLHARGLRSWRHFSVAQRVSFLGAAARDPGVGRRVRLALRRVIWTVSVAALLVVAAQAVVLSRDLPLERARAELRLGRFGAALARAERSAGPDGVGTNVEARLARAGLRVGEGASAAALLDAARAAGEAQDVDASAELAALARLRGAGPGSAPPLPPGGP